MLKFYEGTINRLDVMIAYSGVCKVNAAVAAQLMIDIFYADMIVNAGTAGGGVNLSGFLTQLWWRGLFITMWKMIF